MQRLPPGIVYNYYDMNQSIIIIGAGISGLSAGCYAAMNGYNVQIVEAHSLPGGLCTSWRRKGYLIDDSCHMLMGTDPTNSYYQIWQELGALQGRRIVNYDCFAVMTALDGRTFRLYADPDQLEQHMLELSPADAIAAKQFCGYVRKFADFKIPLSKPAELSGWLDGIKMLPGILPFMGLLGDLLSLTLDGFASRFKDPLLSEGIRNANYGAPGSLFSIVMPLATMSRKAGGYPIGGSLEFARAIEARFTGLGGTVQYGRRVTKVLERNGRATGVRLEDGAEMSADYVIAACDLRSTLMELLDGSRIDPVHQEILATDTLTGPVTQIAIGAALDLADRPLAQLEVFQLPEPVFIGGRELAWFNFKNYACDPSVAPDGKSLLLSMFLCRWPFWEQFKDDPEAYKTEKERTANACIGALETILPGIRQKVEMIDVATPLTYQRYTGNWKGAHMTWQPTLEFQRKHRFIPKTVPGLDGLYLASMWTNPPGGLPGAAEVGKWIAQIICARDRKRFVTSIPPG
jgi:phytoene dehydrogenase-like protein